MGYYTVKLLDEKEYGFEPFVAPANFDRTAQEVDIYEKFKVLNSMDETASWIFSCTDAIQVVLPAVTNVSYIYAETINGVEIISNKIASGTIFTPGSSKRWVCSYYTGNADITVSLPNGSVWGYFYNKLITSFTSTSNTYIKYIHINKLNIITSIPLNAFYNCTNLTGLLTIPTLVISISSQAFFNCKYITGSLIIPNSVTSIDTYAFSGCSGFTGSLTIPNSVTSIRNSIFDGCTGFNGNLTIPNSVTSIGNYSFRNCSFSGTLSIPNSVTSIGQFAFFGCKYFTGNLLIPNSVNYIGNYAFDGCTGFNGALTIPNSVTSIGQNVFNNCSNLTGILTIPNSVTSIGIQAFFGCKGFTGILSIPTSVTNIDIYAFNGCTGFTGFYLYRQAAPTAGSNSFPTISKPLHIPAINSGYNIAPWTTTTIFSSIIADL